MRSLKTTAPALSWLWALTAWESVALFLLCTADMLSTLYWVHTHVATEANPWMALWLRHGDFAFCAVKLLSFLPLLVVTAYYRPSRPRFVTISLRAALGLYVLIYAVSVGGQFFMPYAAPTVLLNPYPIKHQS